MQGLAERDAVVIGGDNSEGSERRVLVVDDNPAIRRILSRLLHLNRFVALEAASIAEAMASAAQHHLCAIILDLNLGEQSGVDLLARLRQQPRCVATPILILTGQTVLPEDDEALIRRNHAHLFHKPQALSTLMEHLARLAPAPSPA